MSLETVPLDRSYTTYY